MKTRTIYTRSRIGLFIGLLSFHTFSSCVNSGSRLGSIENHVKVLRPLAQNIREVEHQDELMRRCYLPSKPIYWYQTKKGIVGLVVVGVTLVLATVGGGVTSYYLFKPGAIGSGFIANKNSTFAGNTMHSPNMTNTSNRVDYHFAGGSKDPMILDEYVIAELSNASFSEEKVRELIEVRGFSPNATTREGKSFLMLLVCKNIDALRYLLNCGADLSLVAPDGSTAVIQAIWGDDIAEFRLLLRYLAIEDLCQKERDMLLINAFKSGPTFMNALQEARQKNCIAEHPRQKRESTNSFIIQKLNEAEKMLREGEQKWGTPSNNKSSKWKKYKKSIRWKK